MVKIQNQQFKNETTWLGTHKTYKYRINEKGEIKVKEVSRNLFQRFCNYVFGCNKKTKNTTKIKIKDEACLDFFKSSKNLNVKETLENLSHFGKKNVRTAIEELIKNNLDFKYHQLKEKSPSIGGDLDGYKELALNGHIQTQIELGDYYYNKCCNRSVNKTKNDAEQALNFYKMAADSGDVESQLKVAWLCLTGYQNCSMKQPKLSTLINKEMGNEYFEKLKTIDKAEIKGSLDFLNQEK